MKLSQIFTIGLLATGLSLSAGLTAFAESQDETIKTKVQTETNSSEASTNGLDNQSKATHSGDCKRKKQVSS